MIYTTELVRRVAMETRLNQKFVSEVLQEALDQIQAELKRGEKVQLTGFGVFYTRQRPEGQVPVRDTNEMLAVPAMRVPAFRPGEALKKAVRSRRGRRGAEEISAEESEV